MANGEFMPSDVVFSEDAFHPVEPLAANMEIYDYEKRYNKVTIACRNMLDKENILQVPILLYRGYQAYDVNTKEKFPLLRTETGMTGIGLPAGYEGRLCMEFKEPLFWRLADCISAVALLTLLLWNKKSRCKLKELIYFR